MLVKVGVPFGTNEVEGYSFVVFEAFGFGVGQNVMQTSGAWFAEAAFEPFWCRAVHGRILEKASIEELCIMDRWLRSESSLC